MINTEETWLSSDNHLMLIDYLRYNLNNSNISKKKLTYLLTSIGRVAWKRLSPGFKDQIIKLEDVGSVDENQVYSFAKDYGYLLVDATLLKTADIIREIFGNPFQPDTLRLKGRWQDQVCKYCGVVCKDSKSKYCEAVHSDPQGKDSHRWMQRPFWLVNEDDYKLINNLSKSIYDDYNQLNNYYEAKNGHSGMLILADKLEGCGCDNVELVMHLRGYKKIIITLSGGVDQVKWVPIQNHYHNRHCWAIDLLRNA